MKVAGWFSIAISTLLLVGGCLAVVAMSQHDRLTYGIGHTIVMAYGYATVESYAVPLCSATRHIKASFTRGWLHKSLQAAAAYQVVISSWRVMLLRIRWRIVICLLI